MLVLLNCKAGLGDKILLHNYLVLDTEDKQEKIFLHEIDLLANYCFRSHFGWKCGPMKEVSQVLLENEVLGHLVGSVG